ncbi:MAG: hypothetical protein ACYDEN_07765 [Acidimicrobiales bacterium]
MSRSQKSQPRHGSRPAAAVRRRLARRSGAPGRGRRAGAEDLPVAAVGRLRPY